MKLILVLVILTIPISMAYMHRSEIKEVDSRKRRLLEILGHTECGICDTLEILKVMSVAMRRVEDRRFPSTLDSVLNQPNQFAGFDAKLDVSIVNSRVRYCADKILRDRKLFVAPDVLGFYHPAKVKNTAWVSKVENKVVAKMPYHYFHRL
jgi:hypothetical protein